MQHGERAVGRALASLLRGGGEPPGGQGAALGSSSSVTRDQLFVATKGGFIPGGAPGGREGWVLALPTGPSGREAVVNALCHRDYAATSQTRLYVFDDRVEIVNPGRLLNELTIDGIRLGGVSQRRNPYLSAAVSRIGLAENIGVGVPEMFALVRDAGFPEPEIQVESGQFRLVVRTTPEGSP